MSDDMWIMGRERALIDGLAEALAPGGPPLSKAKLKDRALRRHRAGVIRETKRGSRFEVQIVGPDGKPTGHIALVTVELDPLRGTPVSTASERLLRYLFAAGYTSRKRAEQHASRQAVAGALRAGTVEEVPSPTSTGPRPLMRLRLTAEGEARVRALRRGRA